MFNVYILKSNRNNKSYIGFTSKEIKVRLDEHNQGTTEWTKNNGPFRLPYYETYYCKQDALYREKFLKSGVGNRIVKLIVQEFS